MEAIQVFLAVVLHHVQLVLAPRDDQAVLPLCASQDPLDCIPERQELDTISRRERPEERVGDRLPDPWLCATGPGVNTCGSLPGPEVPIHAGRVAFAQNGSGGT